jgi:hypothetical protein
MDIRNLASIKTIAILALKLYDSISFSIFRSENRFNMEYLPIRVNKSEKIKRGLDNQTLNKF